MIQVLRKDSRSIPLVICDVCHEPITDAGMAMVVFDPPQVEGQFTNIAYLHKGKCDERYKGGPNRLGGWVELKHFLVDVVNNAGLEDETLSEAIQSRDSIRKLG